MIDENYHIPDIDDEITADKIDDKKNERISIIFEGNNSKKSSNIDYSNIKSSKNIYFERTDLNSNAENINLDEEIPYIDSSKRNYQNINFDDCENIRLSMIERLFINSYRKSPNTVIFTIVGIIIGIMILLIGFIKSMVITSVVLIGHIIGLLLDENPKLMSFFGSFINRKDR